MVSTTSTGIFGWLYTNKWKWPKVIHPWWKCQTVYILNATESGFQKSDTESHAPVIAGGALVSPKDKAPRHGMVSDPKELTSVRWGYQIEALIPNYNTCNLIREIYCLHNQTTDCGIRLKELMKSFAGHMNSMKFGKQQFQTNPKTCFCVLEKINSNENHCMCTEYHKILAGSKQANARCSSNFAVQSKNANCIKGII